LLDRGLAAFDELRQAMKQIDFLADPTAGELRIGATIVVATGFVTAVLDQLSRRYPRIVFHLLAGEAGMTYGALEERKVDLVVTHILAPLAGSICRRKFFTMNPCGSWLEHKIHVLGGAK
jgi:DNA-binding transcriptional LysR family regulator